jgi:biotin carboxyl carrier protein
MEGATMVVKQLRINGTMWTYRRVHQGNDVIIVASDGHNEKKCVVSHHRYDVHHRNVHMQVDGQAFDMTIRHDEQTGAKVVTDLHTCQQYRIESLCHRGEQSSKAVTSSLGLHDHRLKSPLAGRVIKVLVGPAQRVSEGEPLMLIESMKMENEIRSPRPGIIKTILTAEGNVVQPNHILIEFEKEGEDNATTKSQYG